ncbi:hypothetical protein PALB_27190 [Pseudoalteromonas luteoviolacea B = ATCC 29581]|nr:hypothetical protein PALB_27190 [Pseudoalteromonas luteoviolacea B = ATCC 29581]
MKKSRQAVYAIASITSKAIQHFNDARQTNQETNPINNLCLVDLDKKELEKKLLRMNSLGLPDGFYPIYLDAQTVIAEVKLGKVSQLEPI